MSAKQIIEWISSELSLGEAGVKNTVSMLSDGDTVPFISRYRKEKTGNLTEVNVRDISDKLQYYIELEARKETILKSIEEQKKLTPELKAKIENCREKTKLEDLYLPYKPKRQTKATVAKAAGLEPLAVEILAQTLSMKEDRQKFLEKYLNEEKGIDTIEKAVIGAIDIIAEQISDDANIRGKLRTFITSTGQIRSKATKAAANIKTKFEMYYDYAEPLKTVPGHRLLAIRRATKEEVLTWKIVVEDDKAVDLILTSVAKNNRSLFYPELFTAVQTAYDRHLYPSLQVEIFLSKMESVDADAINVFATNAKNLLLAAPAGHKIIMGVDPGFRTGCKVAVTDVNGNFKEYHAIFPHEPALRTKEAEEVLVDLIEEYYVELIAVGNGTASRETINFINNVLKNHTFKIQPKIVTVSEAGASVYSASPLAVAEFPNLDVTVRGAISIARRLQDPLAELVKIDPKSIGVGQYQHDVNQAQLKKQLDDTVESAVNFVGANLNSASAELLSYISGISKTVAKNIVSYRTKNGSFKDKTELKKVTGLGDKTFTQCAGFLRIPDGVNSLDNSAVHPESYGAVEKMAKDLNVKISELIGNDALIKNINPANYVTPEIGLLTLNDIIAELKKPGVDPRKDFSTAEFSEQITDIKDLQENMVLNGTVTNVTNFGAFVDIGVHQDGLIHISKLSSKFVKNPYEVVSVGDTIKVRVLKVDAELKRISLEAVGK
ncbi:Tex family protein [Endomicrobium proavitum]|uniref:Transcriptional accessory protein n=1 Tax=Endomicrobium proavitum TaxID=1408281 RepID=A0A0G3WJE7_9BACT|nr:Tex family protein [Endomicrobium proavitum]AKL97614.1 transcriptional accessory protein [Endomicrobium proavitum]